MKRILAVILLLSLVTISLVYATASRETDDTRALPCTLYGKTSGGVLTAILVSADGTLHTT